MSAGACEGFGVGSVAVDTHNSARSRMSRCNLGITVITAGFISLLTS